MHYKFELSILLNEEVRYEEDLKIWVWKKKEMHISFLELVLSSSKKLVGIYCDNIATL